MIAVDAKAALDEEIVAPRLESPRSRPRSIASGGDLGEMAIRSFVGAGATPLGPLFEDTSDLNAIMQRDELARVALSAGTVTTDELNAIVADLQKERADLDRKRAQAEQLAESLLGAQSETEKLTAQYTQARADAEAKLGSADRGRGDSPGEGGGRPGPSRLPRSTGCCRSGEQLRFRIEFRIEFRWRIQFRFEFRWRLVGWRIQFRWWKHSRAVSARAGGVVEGGHCRQRSDEPAGCAVPIRHLQSRRVVRLLGAHEVRMGIRPGCTCRTNPVRSTPRSLTSTRARPSRAT